MQIPEQLLRLSEKELKKTLKNNIFTSKYIIDKRGGIGQERLIEIEGKIGKFFYPKGRDRISVNSLQDVDYYSPLTFESLQRFRTNNIIENIENWSYETFFKWVLKQFNDVYGEEFVYGDFDDQRIYVHFPEITISNSMEQQHTMYDVYLMFIINNSKVNLRGLKRGTLTDVEIRNNYQFSHCNTSSVFDWTTSFCFGYTRIADLKEDLFTRRKVIQNLRFFLEALKEYLSWESLEGVPYYKIDSVIYDKNLWIPDSGNLSLDITKGMETVMDNIESFSYSFEYEDGKYNTVLSDSSIEEISNILEKHFPEYLLPSLNGNSVKKNENVNTKYTNDEFIYFKDSYRPFKLIKTNSDNVELPLKINSYFVNNVIEKIQNKFNQFLIQKKINDYKG